MREQLSDYARWQESTGDASSNIGWEWENIFPHFVRQENNQILAGFAHGTEEPLSVSNIGNICEMSNIFVKTLCRLQLEMVSDAVQLRYSLTQYDQIRIYQYRQR